MKSIGSKSWAELQARAPISAAQNSWSLSCASFKIGLRLYFEAQVWTVSCASELWIWIISHINMTFFNANHLKSVSLKKSVIFCQFLWILSEDNKWVKSRLKIIVKLSEKCIFWENSSRELEMSLTWKLEISSQVWALALAALLPHNLSLKLELQSSKTDKTWLQAHSQLMRFTNNIS